jgi:hypothetical protein
MDSDVLVKEESIHCPKHGCSTRKLNDRPLSFKYIIKSGPDLGKQLLEIAARNQLSAVFKYLYVYPK